MSRRSAEWAILGAIASWVTPSHVQKLNMTQVGEKTWVFWLLEADRPSFVSEFGVYWYGSR